MIYADTNFFLTLLKEKDWLKEKVKNNSERIRRAITTSIVTFIVLAFFAKKYDFDAVRLFTGVMTICGIEDERALKAAIYIRDSRTECFRRFSAAYCAGKIISFDSVYDRVGVRNQIGRGLKEIGR